jgi:hypothetical protein
MESRPCRSARQATGRRGDVPRRRAVQSLVPGKCPGRGRAVRKREIVQLPDDPRVRGAAERDECDAGGQAGANARQAHRLEVHRYPHWFASGFRQVFVLEQCSVDEQKMCLKRQCRRINPSRGLVEQVRP